MLIISGYIRSGTELMSLICKESLEGTPKVVPIQRLEEIKLSKNDKIIIMTRHPWAIVNSNKYLNFNFPEKFLKIASPKFYINAIVQASLWLKEENPNILLVDLDDLLCNTEAVLDEISQFVSEGDWLGAKKLIREEEINKPKRLNENKDWEISLDIYNHLKKQEWDSILNIGQIRKEKLKYNWEKRVQSSSLSIEESINFDLVANKECEYCDDFDSRIYTLDISKINLTSKYFNPDFDINGYKSIKLNSAIDFTGVNILEQGSYPCLWKLKIPNAIEKYSYETKDCKGEYSKFDILDLYIYLEKIDHSRFWLSMSATGGYDLFSSVGEVKRGKCLGEYEFLNTFKEEDLFKSTDDLLKDLDSSIGKVVGYGGKIIATCGE